MIYITEPLYEQWCCPDEDTSKRDGITACQPCSPDPPPTPCSTSEVLNHLALQAASYQVTVKVTYGTRQLWLPSSPVPSRTREVRKTPSWRSEIAPKSFCAGGSGSGAEQRGAAQEMCEGLQRCLQRNKWGIGRRERTDVPIEQITKLNSDMAL